MAPEDFLRSYDEKNNISPLFSGLDLWLGFSHCYFVGREFLLLIVLRNRRKFYRDF